jgi:death-on-curing protein
MDEITFLTKDDILLVHRNQLDLYGGQDGIRDEGGVDSAVAAPRNWEAYETYEPDDRIPGIAAAYLYAFAVHQYFVDGNKRTGAASADTFLQMNGYELVCEDEEVYRMTKLVAKGYLSRDGIIEWIRDVIETRG